MLGAWIQMGDHHIDRLDLLVLGRDGAHLVRDLISFHRHVLSLNAIEEKIQTQSNIVFPFKGSDSILGYSSEQEKL